MRVFVTGDVHGNIDIHKFNSQNFDIGNFLNKEDIVIVTGDAGFVLYDNYKDEKIIGYIEKKPWTTVYVDGNHENFNALKKYPIVDFYGAKAHQISNSIYHIFRGEIMILNGKSYLCFGGGFSRDVIFRTEDISWWQSELPTKEEIDNAYNNLKHFNNKVDFIITHDVCKTVNQILGYHEHNMIYYDKKYCNLGEILEDFYHNVSYKYWFAGHYHCDNIHICYHDILEVKDNDFLTVSDSVNKILNKSFSVEQIKEYCILHDLYISGIDMIIGTKERVGTIGISVKDFFSKGYTLSEKKVVEKMFKQYLIMKDT